MIDVPVLVKDALREGNRPKRYRFIVLNDDGSEDFVIDNDTLVYESVQIDERMCSGDNLKFGLCEGASLEFQYFDHENITGRRLQAFCDVDYQGSTFYEIPMGFFTVKKCSRQASTGIQKVTAYNKLQSEYLDADAKDKIIDIATTGVPGSPQVVNIGLILDDLLDGYSIKKEEYTPEGTWQYIYSSTSSGAYSGAAYYNADYHVTSEKLHILNMQLRFTPSDYSIDNIYRGVLRCAEVYSKVYDYIPSNLHSQLLAFTGSGTTFATLDNFFTWGKDVYNNNITNGGGYVGIAINAGSGQTYAEEQVNACINRTLDQKSTVWMINVNATGLNIVIPAIYLYNAESTHIWTQTEVDLAKSRIDDIVKTLKLAFYEESAQSDIEKRQITAAQAAAFSNVTLRDLQSAVFESQCQYGQLDRVTDLFYGVELNHTALYPAENLYPADTLYPGGTSETSFKSWYSKLWTDIIGEQSFRKLIITYKGLDANNVAMDFTLEETVNADGTTDYVMDSNWLFKNLIWTQADIEAYASAMAAKMQNIRWFPFEMWAAGLPYIETGDMIEIIVGDETHTSYVLQRQLNGIQNLQDTYINGALDVF